MIEPVDPPPEIAAAMHREAIATHLMQWHRLVDRETRRVLNDDFEDAQDESILFAIALRNLLRVADLAKDLDPQRAATATAAFNHEVPHATNVRNIFEHFDDYERNRSAANQPADGGHVWHLMALGPDKP